VIVLLIEYAINVVSGVIGRRAAKSAKPPACSNTVPWGPTTRYCRPGVFEASASSRERTSASSATSVREVYAAALE
jgi:hypothetical protein